MTTTLEPTVERTTTRPVEPRRRPPQPPQPPAGERRPSPSRWRAPSRSGWTVAALAAFTAVLYTWGLSRVGYANSYYTAAVRAGAESWKAFFFGSIDPGNFITVDKPPVSLWVQSLSVRAFGFSTWSMLLPEALAGVASVLLLHRLVRKWMGDTAAHLAGFAFALTPVAVLMFRYNQPDALLTLLGVGAASALWKAIETGRTRWLVLCATLVGLAFETKMMQAFLVVPAFALVYLVAGPPRLRRRIAQLFAALVAMVVASGWWVAIVALWPASARPYIGSTSDNSIVSLVLGYNGLSRLFGGEGPSGGGGAGTGFGGASGWLRMFNTANGVNISWLLPLAALGLAAGLWLTRRAPRTDRTRAGWLLWGTWALACDAVFSLSSGIFHPYYTAQLAPAVAALAGAGGVALWQLGARQHVMRFALPAAIALSAMWAIVLLDRTPAYAPWLRTAIAIAAGLAVAGFWLGTALRRRVVVLGAAGLAAVTLLAGPATYAFAEVRNPQNGSLASATNALSSGSGGAPAIGGGQAGGMGSSSTTTSASQQALVTYLEAHRGDATYLVAAFGSQSSASIIIASGEPVMTIGGFNGSDPAPTLAQFKALVASGAVRYVLVDGGAAGGIGGGSGGGGGTTSSISNWVSANGTAVTITGFTGTLYDVSNAT